MKAWKKLLLKLVAIVALYYASLIVGRYSCAALPVFCKYIRYIIIIPLDIYIGLRIENWYCYNKYLKYKKWVNDQHLVKEAVFAMIFGTMFILIERYFSVTYQTDAQRFAAIFIIISPIIVTFIAFTFLVYIYLGESKE